MKKIILLVMFLLITGVFFLCACSPCDRCSEVTQETEKVRQIGRLCGISEATLQKEDTRNILIRIELILQRNDSYNGELLTNDDINILHSSFAKDFPAIQKVDAYHQYIKSLDGKNVLLLPRQ